MEKGMIYNIQKFSVHDGPGIRTTIFLKGCPLNCQWCHNPESQNAYRDILYFEGKCSSCGICQEVCSEKAIFIQNNMLKIDRKTCTLCGRCIEECHNKALQFAGEEVTVDELLEEIEKDIIFYDESNGGVTFSGGEPLLQHKFLNKILMKCKEQYIHTAVDTSGYAPWENFEGILDNVDLFLYDIKIINELEHKKYTGVSNELIIENLLKLIKHDKRIIVRIPIIPTINDNHENLEATGRFLSNLNIEQVNILPYHDIGKDKYLRLGRNYILDAISVPSAEKMNSIKNYLAGFKLNVKIGG